MPALASEVFGLAHLAGNYSLLSVRAGRLRCELLLLHCTGKEAKAA